MVKYVGINGSNMQMLGYPKIKDSQNPLAM